MHGYDHASNVHLNGVHKNLCTVMISLYKNNLNLPMCSSLFSALCLIVSSSRSSCCHTHSLAPLILFVCFWRSRFCSSAINQTSLSQSKGWFSFILLCRLKKISLSSLDLHINYTNMRLYEEKCVPSSTSAENIFTIRKINLAG